MQRITVAILEGTGQRVYHREPYMNIPGASILYYPLVSQEILSCLKSETPQKIHELLGGLANI